MSDGMIEIKVSTVIAKVRVESMLVENLFHPECLLHSTNYKEYGWISEHFVGDRRPKILWVIDKLKSLSWKMTHQTMNEKTWMITFERDES